MEQVIVNAHAIDSRNIGDLVSAPTRYFSFPHRVETLDLRSLDPTFPIPKSGFGGSITLEHIRNTADQITYHLIVGGGGLLFKQFLGSFEALAALKSVFRGRWIVWGAGQQIYPPLGAGKDTVLQRLEAARDRFDYQKYVGLFDLVGIRDSEAERQGYHWVPCASCLDPAFDQPPTPQHEFVVFSHRKFRIKFKQFPSMSHDTQNLSEVLDFLGSGQTIITSSYHGTYWGTLLGRRVLAFPFSTKFLTLKYPPALYPVKQWNYTRWQFRPFKQGFLNRIQFNFQYGDYYYCQQDHWQEVITAIASTPSILMRCREANLIFEEQVREIITAS